MSDPDRHSPKPDRRRRALLAAAIAAPLAAGVAMKPRRKAGSHSEHFSQMQDALKRAGLFRPTLVINRPALEHNIGRLKGNMPPDFAFRVVAKSLPSVALIDLVRKATGTDRLMVFDQGHLNLLASQMPDAQLLLGKPMPAGAAKRFFDKLQPGKGFDAPEQVEWLVDTQERIGEYAELARARNATLKVNLELDVGLHRGGFKSAFAVGQALQAVAKEPLLQFSGFMGYEAHASKIPGFLGGPRKALDKALAYYAQCVDVAREQVGEGFDPGQYTLNAGGSSTYEMYSGKEPCNELAVGSALVMPTDFDRPTLADHKPACYIATPVLKALDRTELPGLENLSGTFKAWDPNTERAFYIYGGYWLADVVSPPGLQRNAIWGHSTNQDLLNGSRDVKLEVDDFVFLRPHQSEFVFLQFGDLAVYDGKDIVDAWPVFNPQA